MSQRVDTRTREPDQPTSHYEEELLFHQRQRELAATGQVVVRSKDLQWETSRQGRLRHFCTRQLWEKQAAPGWSIFAHDIRRHSGKHIHQGGLIIFVLEGSGHTIIDGLRYDWHKGDLIVLPIKPGGCEHQHFNAVEGEPCQWIAFNYRPLKDALGHEFTQVDASADWGGGSPVVAVTNSQGSGQALDSCAETDRIDQPTAGRNYGDDKAVDLLESLFRWRDRQRHRQSKAPRVVVGEALEWERNRMGWFRWYSHPLMESLAARAIVFYVQEIPPGGRSGMQLHQGGRVHLAWEGRGYTVIDGVRHQWEAGDLVMLPVRPEGTTHQHVNLDPDRPARLVVAEPNLFDALGVDLGSGFEQLAEASDDPEWRPSVTF